MSPESMTNALLILLISLISTIAAVGYKKVNELIREVKALFISHINHKNDIINLQDDVEDHKNRITELEKNKLNHNY